MKKTQILVRFGVEGADGRRSCVWNVWVSDSHFQGERRDDVYIAPRPIASRGKISLHGSGACQFALTTREQLVDFIGPDRPEGRHLIRWTRVAPTRSATLAARIIVPESELRTMPAIEKAIHWVPAPSEGGFSEFLVCFSNMSREQEDAAVAYAGQTLIVRRPLRAETLLIMHRHRLVREDHSAGLAAARERLRAALGPQQTRDRSRGVTFFSEPQNDGSHAFVEMVIE